MRLTFLAFIVGMFFSPCFAQTEETSSRKIISVFPFKIGERGRLAEFRFAFSYSLEVDLSGEVIKIDEFASTKQYKATKFVRDDLFIECMKKWRIEPKGRYFVQFNVGTMSGARTKNLPRDYMLIIDPNKQSLVISLSLDESNTLKDQ